MTNHAKVAVSIVLALVSIVAFAGRAAADNGVTPASLSFLAVVGGANPAPQPFTVAPLAGSTSWTATVSTNDGAPWLSISPSSGTGTGPAVVSVDITQVANTGAGSFNGTVSVAFAGDPRTYAQSVSLYVAPTTVSFAAGVGGSNPASQTLQLSVASSGSIKGSWTATVATSTGGGWLSVSPSSGSATSLAVSATVAGLAVGTYNGTITLVGAGFTGGNNLDTYVPVVLTITTPAVTLSTKSLIFAGFAGGALTTSQTVQVTAASGWTGSVTTTGATNWLSFSPTSGNGNGSFSVTADPSKLSASTTAYMGTITISPTGTGLPASVTVSFTVSLPALSVAPTSLTFNATYGAAAPQPQTVTVTAPSGWTGSVSTTGGGSWLAIAPVSATTSGTFSVTVNSSILSGGQTYTGTITVSPAGGGTPIPIGVTVNVSGPQISVAPQALTFTQVEGQVAQGTTVSLSATPAVSTWSAVATALTSTIPWLSVSPSGGGFVQAAPSIFPNSLAAGLTAAGSPYQGTVTFTDSNATPNALTVQVTLNVTAAAPAAKLTVSENAVSVTGAQASGASPVTILIGNSGSGSVSWAAQAGGFSTPTVTFVSVSPASGSATVHAPSQMLLNFAAGVNPGVYNATVTVTAGAQTQKIAVTYIVTPSVPQLVLGQTSLRFDMASGGVVPQPLTVEIGNSGTGAMSYTATVASGSFLGSLASGPTTLAAGATGSLTVPLAATINVPAGPSSTYGLINLTYAAASSPSTALGTVYITVLLHVAAASAPPTVTAYPGGLILTPSQPSQNVTLSSSSASALLVGIAAVAQTPRLGTWLTATTTSSGSLNPSATVTVSAAAGSMPTTPGVYQGTVSMIFGSGIASQDINVYLVIPKTSGASAQSRSGEPLLGCTPSQLVMVLRQLASNFSSSVGWPQNIEAQLLDDCTNPVNSATVLASFSTGDVPLALSNVGTGIYSATWNPSNANPATVTVTSIQAPFPVVTAAVPGTVAANATPPPVISTAGVVNGASFLQNGQVSPGEIVSVFGTTLVAANTPNSGFPLPTTLGGIKLSMGGVDMPLFFSNGGQVNAQVPTTLSPNTQTSLVARFFTGTTETGDSVPVPISVAAVSPGIFIAAEANAPNQGAILNNPAAQVVDATNPATAGDVITIYCTGLGATTPAAATGVANPAGNANSTVTVTFGALAPVAVQYAGLAPGFVGLYQVNVAVPAGLTPGAVNVVLNQNGTTSNTVTIAVH